MGKLGYAAMAVGERDLLRGPEWLKKEAAAAKVLVLSANLAGADGKPVFPATALVEAGPNKVGIFAVTQQGSWAGLTAGDPLPAARQAVDDLRKQGATFVVALLHLDYNSARKLTGELKGVDVAVFGHDGRYVIPEPAGDALILGAGDRGRQVGKLVVYTDTKGRWANAGEGEAALAEWKAVNAARKNAEERAKNGKSEVERKAFASVIEQQKKRADELRAVASRVPQGRLFKNTFVTLDPSVADDPAAKDEVEATVKKWGDADSIAPPPAPMLARPQLPIPGAMPAAGMVPRAPIIGLPRGPAAPPLAGQRRN